MVTLLGPLDRAHAAKIRRSRRGRLPTKCGGRCDAREHDDDVVIEDRKQILKTYYRVSEGRQHTSSKALR